MGHQGGEYQPVHATLVVEAEAEATEKALRRTEARPGEFAVADAALDDDVAVRRIDRLVVGVVERLLIHVEPDRRSLRRRRCRSLLGECCA